MAGFSCAAPRNLSPQRDNAINRHLPIILHSLSEIVKELRGILCVLARRFNFLCGLYISRPAFYNKKKGEIPLRSIRKEAS